MQLLKILILVLCCVGLISAKLKVCGYESQQVKLCNNIAISNSVECIDVRDSVDCAIKIQEKKADFGAFYPEQSHLVSKFINDDSMVIGEIRHKDAEQSKHSYRTVVVVKSDHTGGVQGMNGKSYCHFGLDFEEAMTLGAKQEFENALVNIQEKCSDKTTIEKEIEKYAQIFSKACRPGTWSYDTKLDEALKSKYSKLCELCDDKSQCKYYDGDAAEKALKCLTEKQGQVVYTTATAAEKFFNLHSKDKDQFRLLCRNGELREITSVIGDDCTWRNQPWTMIIGKKDKADEIQNNLREWIDSAYIISARDARSAGKKDWQTALREILTNQNDQMKFYFPDNVQPPQQYLQGNNQEVAEIKQNPQCEMKWCTISDLEEEKCKWLSTAMQLQGIKPKINCVKGESGTPGQIFGCLKKIREDQADAMTIDAHFGYIARKYSHIRTLVNFQEKSDTTTKIYAAIKADSGILTLSDLKGKKACFPEYRGIAWLAFIEWARSQNQLPDNCEFGKNVGDYFTQTCAPGVDDLHYRSAGADSSKLCSLCKKTTGEQGYCPADNLNQYYQNSGSVKCLQDGADVAFVDFRQIDKNTDMSNFKILCRNGDVKDIDLNNLNELEEECAITATVNSEVVSKTTNKGNYDYKELLLRMDSTFGIQDNIDETMNMYSEFKGEKNLLFKEVSVDMTDPNESDNKYVKNYIKLFNSVDKCSPNSGNHMLASSLLIFIAVVINNLYN